MPRCLRGCGKKLVLHSGDSGTVNAIQMFAAKMASITITSMGNEMNQQQQMLDDNFSLDTQNMQLLRPRITLTFGDHITVIYSHLSVSGPSVSVSLEEGEEAALKVALDELKLDLREIDPVVECFLPLRDVRLSRGMAGSSGDNGQITPAQVSDCLVKARTAAADVSPGWAGTRIWGDISEIVIDGTPVKASIQAQTISGNKFRVEVLEAFYIPDVESARIELLRACGLNAPTWQHLSIVNYVEAFTTKDERETGIATVRFDNLGAEIAVSAGGHVVALGLITENGDDPKRLLLEADVWLNNNGWNIERIHCGIRLLCNELSSVWYSSLDANVSMPVSFPDDPAVSMALRDELLCSDRLLKSTCR